MLPGNDKHLTQEEDDLTTLRDSWNKLYRTRLPTLARAKDKAQQHWPVVLDHCFARIILDNTVGAASIDSKSVKPWNTVIKSPAVHNMTAVQLRQAIALGEKIASGDAVLTELDENSLASRGKGGMSSRKGYGRVSINKDQASTKSDQAEVEKEERHEPDHNDRKRSFETAEGENDMAKSSPTKKRATRKGEMADVWAKFRHEGDEKIANGPIDDSTRPSPQQSEDTTAVCQKIKSSPNLTPFRKRVLLLLTQVPRGRYTTYKELAAAAARQSGTSAKASTVASARAVGGAMRNNPYAPAAPCHRVLAADGRIGGFKGEWTKTQQRSDEGDFVREKRAMLKREGVRFDGSGRVVGAPFVDFV